MMTRHLLGSFGLIGALFNLLVATRPAAGTEDLRRAVQENDVARVRQLLDAGADVGREYENHFTAIYFVTSPQVADLLLAKKPRLDLRDSAQAQTPLEHVAERFAEDPKNEAWRAIFNKLRAAGAEYMIDAAIYMDDIGQLRKLLARGDTWVNHLQGAQSVPLRVAARMGRVEICRLLLAHKADPNDFAQGNGFPIMVDAIHGPADDQPEIVKLLIRSGADLRRRITWTASRDGLWLIRDNATALHFAAEAGNRESARLLIEAGVDVNAVDAEQQSALHILVLSAPSAEYTDEKSTERFVALAQYLVDHGASVQAKDNRGRTPLSWARTLKSPKPLVDLLARAANQAVSPSRPR